MIRFSANLKKALLAATVVLLVCDVSLLFAAENGQTAAGNTAANPQLQQLQAQIKALQNSPPEQNSQPVSNNSSSPAALPSLSPLSGAPVRAPLPPEAANVPPPVYSSNQAASAENMTDNAGRKNSVTVSDQDISEAAFNAMVTNSLPMTTTQIQKLRSAYMASQFAAVSTPGTPPRPTASSVFADLSPGATPPVVRLGQGFVTSLVFVDSTGAPWPIESYDVGNPAAFNIQWDKISNTLMIQSTVLYTYGNLAIRLKGLNTPVMITLIPGQKAIDYRVDMRIPGYGPSANPFSPPTTGNSTSEDLLNVLNGVPPPNSTALKVEGGNCQAWLFNQKMFVRTRLSILSPGWTATLSSADGMHAYQMHPTPMLLVSQNGQVVQLKVEGF